MTKLQESKQEAHVTHRSPEKQSLVINHLKQRFQCTDNLGKGLWMVSTENKDIISHSERGIMTIYLTELKLSIEEMSM